MPSCIIFYLILYASSSVNMRNIIVKWCSKVIIDNITIIARFIIYLGFSLLKFRARTGMRNLPSYIACSRSTYYTLDDVI